MVLFCVLEVERRKETHLMDSRVRIEAALVLSLGILTLAGCAARPASDAGGLRIGDNINIYEMYDNSRPWGASYLVGPPMHHDGDQSRIDDLRSAPPNEGRALDGGAPDPSSPPAQEGLAGTRPLPPLP